MSIIVLIRSLYLLAKMPCLRARLRVLIWSFKSPKKLSKQCKVCSIIQYLCLWLSSFFYKDVSTTVFITSDTVDTVKSRSERQNHSITEPDCKISIFKTIAKWLYCSQINSALICSNESPTYLIYFTKFLQDWFTTFWFYLRSNN